MVRPAPRSNQKTAGSWFLPLVHERIESTTTPSKKAAEQLKQVCQKLDQRPLALYDNEYGSGLFLKETDAIPAICSSACAPIASCAALRRLTAAMAGRQCTARCSGSASPSAWGKPDEEWELDDPKPGRVRLQRWNTLNFEQAPKRIITLFRLERLEARGARRDPQGVWLGCCGEELPRNSDEWREYLNRFVIEHGYRFIKQSLNWTRPRLSTPGQSELWSTLVIIAYWQLWLARSVVADGPRPWQKAQPELTPGRVHQAMGGILATIGTPTAVPKPRESLQAGRKGASAPNAPATRWSRSRLKLAP
jgi:hypothetical protein